MTTSYLFHQNRISEKINKINMNFQGFHTPLDRYICNKNGLVDETKVEKLAEILINKISWLNLTYKYEGMDGSIVRCLELFFYLSFLSYNNNMKTFGDLLDYAKRFSYYETLDELILDESNFGPPYDYSYNDDDEYIPANETDFETWERHFTTSPFGRGAFADLGKSFELLSGHNITDELTKEELFNVWKRHDAKVTSKQEAWKRLSKKYSDKAIETEYIGQAPSMDEMAGLDPYLLHFPFHPEKIIPHQKVVLSSPSPITNAKNFTSKSPEKWLASFQNPNKYIDAYREFRELIFDIPLPLDDLTDAVFLFLCQEGLAPAADGNSFIRLHTKLDQVYHSLSVNT